MSHRRTLSLWTAGLLAIAASLAAPVLWANTAQADTTICDTYATKSVSSGQYIVMNNKWGASTAQCLNVTDNGFTVTTSDHNLPTNGAPAAYPAIYAGCHYGACTTNSGLPKAVNSSDFGSLTTSVSMSYPSSGQWDAAYDIWFDPTARTDGQNTGAELMIWLNHAGSPQPIGSPVGTVTLAGGTWTVWEGNIGWNVVSYVRTTATTTANFTIKDFYTDMVNRGYAQNSWYMTSVQAGFEPWVGGAGLAVNSFTYGTSTTPTPTTTTTSPTTGQHVVGKGSGKCLDIKDLSTADGAPIQIWDCGTGANQNWTHTNGTFVNPATGKCLDITAASTSNGAKVQLYTCNGTNAQQWTLNTNGTITNPASGKCLDATGQATTNGTLLQIYDCNGNSPQANQVWTLT